MKQKIFFLIMGIAFGFVLIKSGVSNYNVISEMFLFKSFHLYGVLGVAVGLSFIGTHILEKLKWKGILTGEELTFPRKKPDKTHVIGGLMAGLGWGLTGACPGPALAQVGFGTLSGIFTVVGIFLGVYVFGIISNKK
jgi:uncharacterized membrane protein YedE/YeeE